MFRKLTAVCIASTISCTAICSLTNVFAEESSSNSTIETVIWEKSNSLYFEVKDEEGNVSIRPLPDSKITGQIAVTVHDMPIHVTITSTSTEGLSPYYDVDIAPMEGQSATRYIFLLDYSEMPQDPSQFETTFVSPYLTQIYNASYNITISDPSREEAVYYESELVIADPHAEEEVNGITQYAYDVSFTQGLESAVVASSPSAVTESGNLTVSRNLQFLWIPYSLGDVDNNQSIDTTDAYYTLLLYSRTSAGTTDELEGVISAAADINKDDSIDTKDAYYILLYYSFSSVGKNITFEDIINGNY